VHDAVTDFIVSIFAPKNFLEMARVLRCGGWLVLAYPGPEHLIELRDRFGLLRQDEEKPARYADMATRFIGPLSVARLHRRAVLDPVTVRALILMGPNARHIDLSVLDLGPDPLLSPSTSVSFLPENLRGSHDYPYRSIRAACRQRSIVGGV